MPTQTVQRDEEERYALHSAPRGILIAIAAHAFLDLMGLVVRPTIGRLFAARSGLSAS